MITRAITIQLIIWAAVALPYPLSVGFKTFFARLDFETAIGPRIIPKKKKPIIDKVSAFDASFLATAFWSITGALYVGAP